MSQMLRLCWSYCASHSFHYTAKQLALPAHVFLQALWTCAHLLRPVYVAVHSERVLYEATCLKQVFMDYKVFIISINDLMVEK